MVVFHFPEGDSVALRYPTQSYYYMVHIYGREKVWKDKRNFGKIITRPVDKRENYVKRCVGIPGDEIKLENGQLFVNGKAEENRDGMQYNYLVKTNGTAINPKTLDKLHIAVSDRENYSNQQFRFPLTQENANKLKAFSNVVSIEKTLETPDQKNPDMFPVNGNFNWNIDNYGPIKVPAEGTTVQLNNANLPLYERIIDVYEENDLEVNGDVIKINGETATSYTFKMDYYWMMGDNRQNSADSRYWGFVPEDHIVGKAKFIWLSLDKEKSFPANIRFKRMFTSVR